MRKAPWTLLLLPHHPFVKKVCDVGRSNMAFDSKDTDTDPKLGTSLISPTLSVTIVLHDPHESRSHVFSYHVDWIFLLFNTIPLLVLCLTPQRE